MKTTHMVYAILVFGIIVSFTTPHLMKIAYADKDVTYEATKETELAGTTETVNTSAQAITEASSVDVAVATPVIQEVKVEEPKVEVKQEVKKQETTTSGDVVYDGLTMEQLAAKLDKSLNSNLSGTGNLFAKYSIQYGVDPYLSLAIVLHETGCKWSCSSAVRNHNNVGGMYSGGSLIHFDSLESGIEAFMKNLKKNYYDKGLNTPELMNKKYASSSAWAGKINSYINSIKNS